MSATGLRAFLSALSFVDFAITLAAMEAGSYHEDAPGDAPQSARIAARSQRQAMDWSLVLASQEIHPIITGPGDSSEEEPGQPDGWALLVPPAEYDRALAAIRQYRLENRGWSWRQELPGANIDIHTGAVLWCLFLVAWHWVMTFIAPGWFALGEMSNVEFRGGDWWRLFTPILLHSDLAHLMANATFGTIFLGLAMARFGWGVTLLATFSAGVLGNVLGYLVYEGPYRGRGASGMMMGALGLLCIHSFGLWRKSPKAARYIISGVIAGVLLFVMFGLNPDSDIVAHFGGFAAGLILGGVLAIIPETKLHRFTPNLASLVLLLVIIAVTWAFALR